MLVVLYTQGKQFLYGDTSVLLSDQADIMELIGGNKEDTREQYSVRKDLTVDDSDLAGLQSTGTCSTVTKIIFYGTDQTLSKATESCERGNRECW